MDPPYAALLTCRPFYRGADAADAAAAMDAAAAVAAAAVAAAAAMGALPAGAEACPRHVERSPRREGEPHVPVVVNRRALFDVDVSTVRSLLGRPPLLACEADGFASIQGREVLRVPDRLGFAGLDAECFLP